MEIDDDNWPYEGYKEPMKKEEEDEADGAAEEDIDGEERILDREDWVTLGTGTTALIVIIMLAALSAKLCRRRNSPKEETYVAYEHNEEEVHFGKDYEEARLHKELDAIEDLSNQMSGMVRTLEKMADVHGGLDVRGQHLPPVLFGQCDEP